jgi:hypothetical protein
VTVSTLQILLQTVASHITTRGNLLRGAILAPSVRELMEFRLLMIRHHGKDVNLHLIPKLRSHLKDAVALSSMTPQTTAARTTTTKVNLLPGAMSAKAASNLTESQQLMI